MYLRGSRRRRAQVTRKRLEELLARYTSRMARRYRQIMERTRDRRTIAELEVALETGKIAEVLDEVTAAGEATAAELVTLDAVVGAEVAAYLTRALDKLITYDGTNARAVEALRAQRLRFVWGLREDQRLAFGETLARGLGEGVNPRQIAIGLRESLGLTPDRAQWVANYRRALESADRHALTYALRDRRSDGVVLRAIETQKPLSPKRIDDLVERYYQRQVASRSVAIARTEMLRALHTAQDEAYEQAIDSGILDAARIQEEWHVRVDGKQRDSHGTMRGQLRPYGVAFKTGAGNLIRYPGDPNAPASETIHCRCVKTRRVLAPGQLPINGQPSGPSKPSASYARG